MVHTHYPGTYSDSCSDNDEDLLRKARAHEAYAHKCADRLRRRHNRRRSDGHHAHKSDSGSMCRDKSSDDKEFRRQAEKDCHAKKARKSKQLRSNHRHEDEVSRRGDERQKRMQEHDRKKDLREDSKKDQKSKRAHERDLRKCKEVRERIIQERYTTYNLKDKEDDHNYKKDARKSHHIDKCKDEAKKDICAKRKKSLREGHEDHGRQDEEDKYRDDRKDSGNRRYRRDGKKHSRSRGHGSHKYSDGSCKWGKSDCDLGDDCDIHEGWDCNDNTDSCSDYSDSDSYSDSCTDSSSDSDDCSGGGGNWRHGY